MKDIISSFKPLSFICPFYISLIISSILLSLFVISANNLYAYIEAHPSSITFSATKELDGAVVSTPASQGIVVFDSLLSDNITWISYSDTSWIILSDPSINSGSKDISVSIDPNIVSLLPVGTYSGSIVIRSDKGESISIQVGLAVTEAEPEPEEPFEPISITNSLLTPEFFYVEFPIPYRVVKDKDIFILITHNELLPSEWWAYSCKEDSYCSFYLFSQNGILAPNYEELKYNLKNVLINSFNSTVNIPFGGFRLIGLEGDAQIKIISKDPFENSIIEILNYNLSIQPIVGSWLITEYINGIPFEYKDELHPENKYLMTLYEHRGQLAGQWRLPRGDIPLNVSYGAIDPSCEGLVLDALTNSIKFSGCNSGPLYVIKIENYYNEVRNTEMEMIYNIYSFNGTMIEGNWQYREKGKEWSLLEPFKGVRYDNSYTPPH